MLAGMSLHSASTSSATSSATSYGKSDKKSVLHPLTATSISQLHSLENAISGSTSDPQLSERNWIDIYSLDALKLTLDHIIEHCKIPRQEVLVEFPFSQYLTVLDATKSIPPARAMTNIDKRKVALKRRELKLLIKFYKNRIDWLLDKSRRFFGLVMGKTIAVVVENSACLAQVDNGELFQKYKSALNLLINEQLINMDTVYFIKCGISPGQNSPLTLPFTKFKTQCIKYATEWVSSLEGEPGYNLLDAIKLALGLQGLDTICLILSTRPNQPLDILGDYLIDKLSGESAPKLHLVSFSATEEIQASLSDLATDCCGHFHGFSSKQFLGDVPDTGISVDDSDIHRVKEEIVKTQKILCDLKSLKHGVLGNSMVALLRELSLGIEWEEDDDFPFQPPPIGDHCLACSTVDWLTDHGIEGQKLNLYRFLAPNAYPQLEDHVQITDSRVVSQVYDVMPLIPWDDGSLKYLHVDVHGIESYLSILEGFIVDKLQARLSWLQSGSRVPLGMLVETKVLLVIDSSSTVMGQVLVLQQHLKMLLEEQLAYVQEFNLTGFGNEFHIWTSGFAEPHRQSLLQAWEWILSISPSGSGNLLLALKNIFESGNIFEEGEESVEGQKIGIYLVISSMPDQTKDVVCSYLEQVVSGSNIHVHVIYYNTEPLRDSTIHLNNDGGRCGLEKEIEDYLRALAKAGKGRFHHFKLSGTCQSDDISELMEEICCATNYLAIGRSILDNYKDFCRRNVPAPTLESNSTSPKHKQNQDPPLYPRQTASSLARMNACFRKIDVDGKQAYIKSCIKRRKKQCYLRNHFFYTGRGLDKANAWDLVEGNPSRKLKTKFLIPRSEEYMSSKKWIHQCGLDALDLHFSGLIPRTANEEKNRRSKLNTPHHKTSSYKHVNHQGEVTDLCVNAKGLRDYVKKLQTILKRYHERLQWINEDHNKYFGVVTEQSVLFLMDVSSSMATHMEEMKESLLKLLQNMPLHVKSFNLIAYSTSVQKCCHKLELVSKETVSAALQWLGDIKTGGNSYLLQALRESLESGATGIYLITDGLADHTHPFLLNQLPSLQRKYGNQWKINTVGWFSSSSSESFLKELAHASGGRFHCYPHTSQGDDQTILAREISLAQLSLIQAKNYL